MARRVYEARAAMSKIAASPIVLDSLKALYKSKTLDLTLAIWLVFVKSVVLSLGCSQQGSQTADFKEDSTTAPFQAHCHCQETTRLSARASSP